MSDTENLLKGKSAVFKSAIQRICAQLLNSKNKTKALLLTSLDFYTTYTFRQHAYFLVSEIFSSAIGILKSEASLC